jgi:hypothetical protein
MRLLLKLNLVLLLTFGVGVAISGYVARDFLQRNAREQVVQQARLMMGAALATRTYTALADRRLLRPSWVAGHLGANLRR